MWRQMYEQAEEGILKVNAEVQLRVLAALDHADRLTEAVRLFEAKFSRAPASLAELRASGLAPEGVVDAAGIPFEYDSGRREVVVSPKSPLWRPPPPRRRGSS
jgi:hypothetical protein